MNTSLLVAPHRLSASTVAPLNPSQASLALVALAVLCATFARPAYATWLIASPPRDATEVKVFADPGAQRYSRFEPRFKVIAPEIYGACDGGVNPTTFREGWANVGGLAAAGATAALPIVAGLPTQGPVRYGSAQNPLRPILRVDLNEHMKLPEPMLADGNSANDGPQRAGGLPPPVAACNAHLSKLGTEARRNAARNGFTVNVPQAIRGAARMDCSTNFALTNFTAPVVVKCEPAPALINRVSLRVEWSQQEACPSEVRLIGVIDGNFTHSGKRIFMGNQFLGGYEPYQIGSGQMTVVETRKLNWPAHAQGTLASAPGAVSSIDGWAQLNVQPNNELPGAPALFSSERVHYRVTCRNETPQRAMPQHATPQRATGDSQKR